jgi:hypothetical protein
LTEVPPVHKPAALALVLLALAVLPATADTWLLGGVLATGVIDDDESGLVNITGIRGSVEDVDLPYVADLLVYLRWEGEGKHTVDLEVLDPHGDVVADFSEDVDFKTYGTNFTTHSLENTVFETEGTYMVAVYVDDEELLELPYCVNGESEGSEGPYLLMSVTAVDGWSDESGQAEIEGAFEHYTFKRFPAADDFAIVTLWFSGDDSYRQRIEIKDPAGKVVGISEEQDFEAWPGELTVVTDRFENFLFKVPGDYLVTVYLDDEEHLTYLLRAVLAK